MIFASTITATVIVVFVVNLVFNHWERRSPHHGAGGGKAGRVAVNAREQATEKVD